MYRKFHWRRARPLEDRLRVWPSSGAPLAASRPGRAHSASGLSAGGRRGQTGGRERPWAADGPSRACQSADTIAPSDGLSVRPSVWLSDCLTVWPGRLSAGGLEGSRAGDSLAADRRSHALAAACTRFAATRSPAIGRRSLAFGRPSGRGAGARAAHTPASALGGAHTAPGGAIIKFARRPEAIWAGQGRAEVGGRRWARKLALATAGCGWQWPVAGEARWRRRVRAAAAPTGSSAVKIERAGPIFAIC